MVNLSSTVDLAHGGRWTSLRTEDREWLWRRTDPARSQVRPGQAFVDAGGLEECIPTVRGNPDHGAAWSAAWRRLNADTATVTVDDFVLTRTLRHDNGGVIADYRLAAVPGYRFVWAAHALLELSDAARLDAPAGLVTRVYDVAEQPWATGAWPAPLGVSLDRFGPADGTAVGAILLDCPRVVVADGPDRLAFTLSAPGQPVSTALWRNLGGFPQPAPYRSIGVEPMLGRVFDRAEAGPGDAAVVPASGVCEWRLTIT
jgi:hypothetical protein